MSYLLGLGKPELDLIVGKQGTGRLYYRLGLDYALRDLRPPPQEQGFSVTRTYEAIDRPNDVERTKQGVWRIRRGARVRVRVFLVAPADRHHVELVDPLPAGFETLDPLLAITPSLPESSSDESPARSQAWYEHSNFRDDRSEVFAGDLPAGVHMLEYACRATRAGTFLAPPPRAHELYTPETFGRGRAEWVVVASGAR